MKKSKKKVLAVSLVIVVLAIAIAGGSLAWFTDDDKVTNTFTIGDVKIDLHEQEHNATGELVDFTQKQMLLPINDPNKLQSDDNYIEKLVTVENTGKNPAYVRVNIAIPTSLVDYLYLDINTEVCNQVITYGATIDGESCTVYAYDYTSVLPVNSSTEPILKGVYIDSSVDLKDNPNTEGNSPEFCKPNGDGTYTFSGYTILDAQGKYKTVPVWVVAQAIQSEGFTDATTALNSGFGENTNPWARTN